MEGQPKVRSSPKCWKSTGDRAPLRSNCPPGPRRGLLEVPFLLIPCYGNLALGSFTLPAHGTRPPGGGAPPRDRKPSALPRVRLPDRTRFLHAACRPIRSQGEIAGAGDPGRTGDPG